MQKALTKASSFIFNEKARKEIASIGDDLNSFTNTVEGRAKWVFNKLKGTMKKPLPDLLKEYELPPGLFPKNVVNYEFDATRNKITVHLPCVCEIGFRDTVIKYSTRVTGILLRGKMTGIEGMKTKVMIWVKVTTISVDGPRSSKVHFTAGVKRSKPKEAFETLRESIPADEF